ncbi:hypothetical protein V6N12_049494 [Hibiscus sabdariffa]|uniref:Uncharacterized protein n=1 Tax=Hibiscus sabdariffa TaxID=183260 RepID=A0ABR2CBH6_9ROSI
MPVEEGRLQLSLSSCLGGIACVEKESLSMGNERMKWSVNSAPIYSRKRFEFAVAALQKKTNQQHLFFL